MIRCNSDLAAALSLHAETHLDTHHSPDVFHVQHDTSRATSVPLRRQSDKSEKAFKDAEASNQQNTKKIADFNGNWPCSFQKLDLGKELIFNAQRLELKKS